MEVQRKQRFTLLQHLLFWLGYILYEAASYGWEDTDTIRFYLAPQIISVHIPIVILLTYVNLYLLLPRYYYTRKYVRYAVAVALLLFAGGLLMRFLTHSFILPWEQVHDPVRYQQENKNFWIPVRILRLSLQAYPVVALSTLLQLMRNAYFEERKLRQVADEKHRAEMALLRLQINPHFFFNTLNSVYALTLKGSELASVMVLRLSHLMHYMLEDSGADKVQLKDEICYLNDYIGIEQLRFAERLDLSFQYSGDISGKMIAPLLLLPFIENAFKHGISEGSGWITIDLKVMGDRLFLKVENSYPTNSHTSGHGVGLRNVQRRLELMYRGRYSLQLNRQEDFFEADLKIDL